MAELKVERINCVIAVGADKCGSPNFVSVTVKC
jgi:hypothetical protein